jgi:hypothetical protein
MLIVLFIATLGGFAFAFITGFSIGRFMVLLPLVTTAYAVSYGRGLRVRLGAYAIAVGLYLLLAWLRPDWASARHGPPHPRSRRRSADEQGLETRIRFQCGQAGVRRGV